MHCNMYMYSKDESDPVQIDVTGCKNISAFKIVAGQKKSVLSTITWTAGDPS